jgi:hypothetical protein
MRFEMNTTQLKHSVIGVACAAAMAVMPLTASAQLSGGALPIDGLTGILGSTGGLGSLGGLGDLGSLAGAGGGLGGLNQLTGVINSGTGALGVGLPDFAFGLFDGGLATLSALGLDIVQGILADGGLGGIPLLGGDIAAFATPEGLVSGLTGLSNFELPISIPVIGPHPFKLYGPVVLSILDTQGLPVGGIPLPF